MFGFFAVISFANGIISIFLFKETLGLSKEGTDVHGGVTTVADCQIGQTLGGESLDVRCQLHGYGLCRVRFFGGRVARGGKGGGGVSNGREKTASGGEGLET